MSGGRARSVALQHQSLTPAAAISFVLRRIFALVTSLLAQAMDSTTPPSTRSAVPVVAEERGEAR